MTLPIIIDRRRQLAAMQREAPDDTGGQDGGAGATKYATKAHAVPAGRGFPDPRERILEAARQVERSPYGKDSLRSVPERKSGTGAKSGAGNAHEYMTE